MRHLRHTRSYARAALLALGVVACGTDSALGGDPTAVKRTHCGAITEPETWAGGVHYVTCEVIVELATLTIAPGTEVVFYKNTGITVAKSNLDGGLIVGSADDVRPVTMRALAATDQVDDAAASAGPWRAINIASCFAPVSLQHVQMQGGGSDVAAMLIVEGRASFLLNDVTLTNSQSCGLALEHGLVSTDSTALVIKGSALHAVCATADSIDTLPATDSDYTNNTLPGFLVNAGLIDRVARWRNFALPYDINGDVDVEKGTLSIDAGTSLRFVSKTAGINVAKGGHSSSFKVLGTASQHVTIAPGNIAGSATCTVGCWAGIGIYRFAHDVSLAFVDVTGGGGRLDANVYVEKASILLQNVTLQNSLEYGLHLTTGAVLAEGSTALSATNNETWGVRVEPVAVGTLPTASVYTPNTKEGILVAEGALKSSATWASAGVAYAMQGSMTVDAIGSLPAVLTLAAGVRLEFFPNTQLGIATRGGAAGLTVAGTPSRPVVLSAYGAAVPGAWNGVILGSGTYTDQTHLQNMRIEYAGNVNGQPALDAQRLALWFDGLTVAGSAGTGVRFSGGGSIDSRSSGLTVSTCAQDPIVIELAAVASLLPTMVTSLASSTRPYIKVTTETAASNPLSDDVTWWAQALPYWIDGDLVLDHATLTVQADADLQFVNNSTIRIGSNADASLITVGTASRRVQLRAGQSTTPGAWNGITIGPFADLTSGANHVHLAYTDLTGAGMAYGAIVIDRTASGQSTPQPGTAELEMVTIKDAGAQVCGIRVKTGSAPSVTSVTFINTPGGNVCL